MTGGTATGDHGVEAPVSFALGVRAWARREPDRVAVRDDEGTLSFAELDALAGDLAARLTDAGAAAGPGVAVPLLVARDRWSVVAVQAAVRAGMAFAPLDADLPPAALAGLLARLGAPSTAVVASPELAARLPSGVVPVAVGREPDRCGPGIAPAPVDPEAVATIVFTSGSTGRPKGVVTDWALWELRHEEALRFDAFHADGTPMHGAVLMPFHWIGGLGRALVPGVGSSITTTHRALGDPAVLAEWFRSTEVSVVTLVPSMVAHLAGPAGGSPIPSIRVVSFGGEGVRWEHVAGIRPLVASDAVVRNTYGASEAGGTRVLQYEVGPDHEIGTGPLPLGVPLVPGRVAFVPVADGADDGPSEMVVCGAVARGYLDEPALTAASFETGADGVRRWRTGDLVRIDERGDAYLIGRTDEVVKINGRLVAPQEAEHVLAELDGVAAVGVVAADAGGRPLLVAHLVTEPEAAVTPDAVRDWCRARLAAHVVPSVLVRHDALPLLGNGKVDRVALRQAPVTPWRSVAVREPADATERWCLDEVRRIVGFTDIAPDDDLFAVGLDSLGAVELCAAVGEAGIGTLDASDLSTCRTVAAISRRLRGPTRPGDSTIVRMNPDGDRPPVFVVTTGGESAWGFRFLGEALGPARPVLVVEPRGMHQRAPVDRTLEPMVRHATAEVDGAADPEQPIVLIGYSAGGPVAFEVAQRLTGEGRAVHLVLLDAAPALAVAGARAPDDDLERPERTGGRRRSRWQRARERWFVRVPGRPRSDIARYRALSTIARRALRGHRPGPARFPVTVVAVDGSSAVTATRAFSDDLDVRHVGGTHRSMLMWPHVRDVADAIAEVADRVPEEGGGARA